MPRAGLTAVQYRNRIVKIIHRFGPARALAHKSTGVVYSGPWDTYVGVVGYYEKNEIRSEQMAARLDGSRINDTWIWEKLSAIPLASYFERVYLPLLKDPSKIRNVLKGAYNTVWGGISKEFAKLPFREIATAVCGAAKKQVFYRYELPELVANPHIQICNEIPMEAVRRMYNEVGKDEAFNLVCLSELRMTFRYAAGTATRPIRAWQDFVDRTHFYHGERTATASTCAPLTADQENRKQQIITDFGLNALYTTTPSAWGGPLVPVSPAPKHTNALAVA
ncbi:MAG: hypothetical protein AB7S81_03830 [Bdellovibrionales bacterium]